MLKRYRVGFPKSVPENILDLIDVKIIQYLLVKKSIHAIYVALLLSSAEFTCKISYIMNTTHINVMYVINFY